MRATIYTRVSLDRTGEGAAVARQLEDAQELAQRRGWTIVSEHSDNDTSAAGKRRRPGFEQVLDDLATGRAEAVIAWTLDRLTRNRPDTVRLIETCQEANATVALVRGSDIDLSTPSGRLVADVLASVARSEIETKSDRQTRANAQAARAGKPPSGPVPFGYRRGGMELEPAEADLIRTGYTQLLAGASLRSIARTWNAAGARTGRGNTWDGSTVRRCLSKPRNAALRQYRGEIVGPGNWPAIVDEDTYRAARHLLSDPGRNTVTDRSIKFLLTNIAECGRCGDGARVATARTQHGKRVYKCAARADLARGAEEIDQYVEAVIVARLSQPDALEVLGVDRSGEVKELHSRGAVLRGQLGEAADLFAAGKIRGTQLAAITERVEADLEVVEAQVTAMARSDALAGVVSASDVAAAWQDLDVLAQREIVKALLARVVLLPPGQGARRFNPETVALEWRTGQ